jgi:hypothetical protein
MRQHEIVRRMPSEEKLRMATDLSDVVRDLTLDRQKIRHPKVSEAQ